MHQLFMEGNQISRKNFTDNIRSVVRDSFQRTEHQKRHSYDLGGRQIRPNSLQKILKQIQKHQEELHEQSQIFLSLWKNMIRQKGCLSLSKAQISNLTLLDVSDNKIGDSGCEELSKGQWNLLKCLFLWSNCIGEKGCNHLSKANWRNLRSLSIQYNQIGRKGYNYLNQKFTQPGLIKCDPQYLP